MLSVPLRREVSGPPDRFLARMTTSPGPVMDGWAQATLAALCATGMAPWDAAVALVGAGMDPALLGPLRGLPAEAILAYPNPKEAIRTLEAASRADRNVANLVLSTFPGGREGAGNLHLANRQWIRSLPEALRVRGCLDLGACHALTALPANLWAGALRVPETAIRSVPADLVVDRNRVLLGCRAWDGIIPPFVSIGLAVVTDGHPGGVALANWRAQHPAGKRAGSG